MENFYIILVVVLFALAASDLVVGVANDAVNFLNSAVGSKSAPKWLIFTMAALGVLIGATFSNGMMEVARKGIFHPDMFFFSEIMIVFLAVMITDVIMLDTFNALGMPTSTTVSIVFELLGAAVAVAIVKIKTAGGSVLMELTQYINSDKALAIITGILVSVVIAFTVGAIVQYIARLIFSFNYRQPMKYFGAIYGGVAITAITYFMLIKGINGSSFASIELESGTTISDWISQNTSIVLLGSFIGWTILIQLLKWIFNIKILKVVVLVGTFALAMAFAGNDLVNFIGVPLAGFTSFKAWIASGQVAPDSFSMEMLSGKVDTPAYMLLIAGLIMIATLIFSKKAHAVIATSVDLSRQNEGTEKFDSSPVARILVRSTTGANKKLRKLLPNSLVQAINNRFEPHQYEDQNIGDPPAFDKIRASVNLVVASILIALGTSLKLPLSTTYVTFMVAMGTSLSDRAWDRDSAVFRVSGVMAVIGGWFLTAIIAFSGAATIALLISLGGKIMVFVFIAIAIFTVLRTHLLLKKRNQKSKVDQEDTIDIKDPFEVIISKSSKQVVKAIVSSNYIFSIGIDGFLNEDRNKMKKAEKESSDFSKRSKKNKEKVYSTLQTLAEGMVDTSHYYVQMMDYKREMAHAAHFIIDPIISYSDNNHKPFTIEQNAEMVKLVAQIDEFFNLALHTVKENKFDNIETLIADRDKIFDVLTKLEKSQIKRIKNKDVNTRNSLLYFKINAESKNLLLHTVNMIKAQRDFITYTRQAL
ncbi:MAG TPA: inorganic phosphate transporter [Draconibacterium sp.]|nr:inorganic phosphate transporter [Draconibacterium sp.]